MKRLCKNTHDKKISGVCSGIAEYFGIDPNVVRIGTIILCIITAVLPVAIAYLACAVLLPEA